MVKHWQPGTDYVRGDIVKYHGTYIFLRHPLLLNFTFRPKIQSHPKSWIFGKNESSITSQLIATVAFKENWAPGVAQSLWGKLEDDDDDSGDEHAHGHQERQPEHVQVPEYHRPQYQNDQAPYQPQNSPQQQNPFPPQHQDDQGYAQQGTYLILACFSIDTYDGNFTGKPPSQLEDEEKPSWVSEHKKQLEVCLGLLSLSSRLHDTLAVVFPRLEEPPWELLVLLALCTASKYITISPRSRTRLNIRTRVRV